MGHLVDYVKWRGDLSLNESPFNVFDSMVISALSYIRFEGTVAPDESLPLTEAVMRIRKKKEPVFATCDYAVQKKAYKELLNAIVASRRFSSVTLSSYVDVTDVNDTIQFGAATFIFPNGDIAIGLRGTDETIVGWKENCQLSFMEVSAQRRAAEYVKKQVDFGLPFYLCGHSKGGNLALYGAFSIPKESLALLKHLYLLDAPGLCKEVFTDADIATLDDKTTHIMPYYDVVGQFFPMGFADSRIVHADAVGILQHAFLSWRIEYGGFVERKTFAPECAWINNLVRNWLVDVSLEERHKFVDDIFFALTRHGEKTIWDLGKNPTRTIDRLVLSYVSAGKKERKTFAKLGFAAFFGTSFREAFHVKSLPEFLVSNLTQALSLITIGLLFICLPPSLPWVVVGLVSTMLVVNWIILIYYLAKSHGDWRLYQIRIAMTVLGSLAYAGLAALGLTVIESLFTWAGGMLFLIFALIIGISLHDPYGKNIFQKIVSFIEVTLYFLVGIFLLFAPESILGYGIFITGIIMVSDGIYKLIR